MTEAERREIEFLCGSTEECGIISETLERHGYGRDAWGWIDPDADPELMWDIWVTYFAPGYIQPF